MWPHSSSAHSRPGRRLGRGRRVRGRPRKRRPRLPKQYTRGNRMVRARGLVVLVLAAFVAFACGGTTGGGGAKGEIDIASDLPTSGADASSGLPTQYGAAFAVSQKGSIQGFTLKFVPLDDAV